MKSKKTIKGVTPPQNVPASFLNKLGEMHTAELELTIALPLIMVAAESKDLKALLKLHLKETKGHVKALNQVVQGLNREMPKKPCKRMTAMIAEGVKVIGKRLISGQQDAELIRVGQKIERFEMENYKQLCTTAEHKDYAHEFALLKSVLNQEEIAETLLGQLAQGKGPLKPLIQKASLKRAGAQATED
jgi:ferritin-like metal-binding protein YciE